LLAALLAEVLHLQGRDEEARRFVDRSEETAAPDDLAAQIAWRSARARVLVTTGRLEEAEALARRAVQLAAGTEWTLHHAYACLALGDVLREGGRPGPAAAAIRKALELHQGKGNVIAAEGVHALLAQVVPA
jgi:ATP/maltotriose-dependent transcriptional regulator MalT